MPWLPTTAAHKFLLFWIFVYPIFALGVSIALIWFGPKEAYGPAACYLNPKYHEEYSTIRMLVHITPAGVWTRAEVQISGTHTDAYAEINLVTKEVNTASTAMFGNSYAKPPAAYAHPVPLTQAEALTWLGHAGADMTNQKVQDDASELMMILNGIPHHGLAGLTPTYYDYILRASEYYLPAIWFVKSLMVTWLAIWIVGIIAYWRIDRRIQPSQPTSIDQSASTQAND